MTLKRELSNKGIKVLSYLFNNDFYKDCYGTVPYAEEPEVCYESKPHIAIALIPKHYTSGEVLKSLDGKEFIIELLDGEGEHLFEGSGKLRYVSHQLVPESVVSEVRLPSKFMNARYVRIRIGSLTEEMELPPQVRVYGKVTDFKGRPKKAYIRLVNPYGLPVGAADTKTDDGYFEMYAPAATYHHAFICDGNYGRSSLEFYGWYVPVKPPEFKLNARFDKIEIYRLAVAETPERTLLIHFVAWDIAYTTNILKIMYEDKGKMELKDLCSIEILTPLKKSDVEVYLNDLRLEVRSMRKIEYSIKDYGVNCMSKAYLLEAKVPTKIPPGIYSLRVVAHTIIDGIEEWGEAVLYELKVI
ncbi:MAG: hypothetical protein B6U85_07805 [Desulfurococcales archaeon ex4484_42]|nr:MAG: hypothetical protein B6U85_07805 [Desulfurococcales archaeon ex4484_42]